MKHEIDISGAAKVRVARRQLEEFTARAIDVLHRLKVAPKTASISIAIVDDATMAGLNSQYRRKKKTTDVLTFPSGADTGSGTRHLGDIVIAADQTRRQAIDEKHSIATELQYLILHGLIHSLGYDHETDEGEMNALELEAREKLKLA